MRQPWLVLSLLGAVHLSAAQDNAPAPKGTPPQAGVPSPAALALRREYNGVAAAIDTLVRLYSVDRLTRLADPAATPGARLPEGMRLVLMFWADDEARLFLNGAPVGQTRLTPTRIEIPTIYLEADNVLTAQCWDTDRVESGFMAGLYVEDDAGLRPVVTTAEGQGWEVAAGPEVGSPAQEIFYSHAQPDLPGAEVIWGPQLFGTVDLSAHFTAADVIRATRRAPLTTVPGSVQDRAMEFHESMARLVGLQERRRELTARLAVGSVRSDPHLRFRRNSARHGISYTLGRAGPLQEEKDLAAEQAIVRWRRQLPSSRQQFALHEARALRGAAAATPAAPLLAASAAAGAGDRRADYQPPEDHGTTGEGGGSSHGKGQPIRSVVQSPSTAFLWRMGWMALLLCTWTGIHSWRGWRLWHAVNWEEEAQKRA